MLLRHGLKVRGVDIRLYYPKPRSAESVAAKKYGENRITFRPQFYFGETNQEIDLVFLLNGLPIVTLELKYEKNQTVHDAVGQYAARDQAHKIFHYSAHQNLHCPVVPKPDEEKLYAKGIVAKALMNVAFQDDGLIPYKAEVMLRIFAKDVMPLIGGRAKAMIVTTSRVAGLRYFQIIQEKLKERGAANRVLYAFSDFVHPETNVAVSEHALNGLKDGELIEDRFDFPP